MAGSRGIIHVRRQDQQQRAARRMARKQDRPPDLIEQLRQALAASGLSMNQLGKETGVNQAQLSRFVRGERTLTLPTAAKLCTFLGLYLAGPALGEKE